MIRARFGETLVFGVDATNVERLTGGMPILVDLKGLGADTATRVVIVYGATLQAIVDDMKSNGILPPDFVFEPPAKPPPRGH